MEREILFGALCLVLIGCQSVRTPNGPEPGPAGAARQLGSFAHPFEVASALGRSLPDLEEIARAMVRMDSGEQGDLTRYPGMLFELNGKVRRWIEFFSARSRSFLASVERGLVYKPLVERELARFSVPREFYYLALIESGFVTHAVSRARAVGAWQFLRGTAVRYGLKCNTYVDERRDIIRSTRSAARYLRDLHQMLGSWYLVLAAYNAGGNRMARAVREEKSRDFWRLAEKHALPAETMEIVPKFLAAMLIGTSPARYGFPSPVAADPLVDVAGVKVPASVRLDRIAAAAQLSVAALRRLNPHLLKGMTPPHGHSYTVWIPKDNAAYVSRLWPRVASSPRLPCQVTARLAWTVGERCAGPTLQTGTLSALLLA